MTKNKIVLKKLKREGEEDTVWHPDSRLVFKSKKDKLVVGRLSEDEDMIVDETVIDLCNKWKFKIDPSLVESASEEEVEEEVEEEEVESKEEAKEEEETVSEQTHEKRNSAAPRHSKAASEELMKSVKKYCSDMEAQTGRLQSELRDLKKKHEEVTKSLSDEKEKREKAEAKLAKIREQFS